VTSTRLLVIYLNDHLTGSTALIERVRHAADEHEDTLIARAERQRGEVETHRIAAGSALRA
jgi:hypothetical protein